jgi:hypothetical protein
MAPALSRPASCVCSGGAVGRREHPAAGVLRPDTRAVERRNTQGYAAVRDRLLIDLDAQSRRVAEREAAVLNGKVDRQSYRRAQDLKLAGDVIGDGRGRM